MPENLNEPVTYQDIEQGLPEETNEDIFMRSEMLKITKELINDEPVEEKLADMLWAFKSKTMKLTFLNQNDTNVLNLLFEAEVCKMLRHLPKIEHTPELYEKLGQARVIALLNIKRAMGTNDRNKMNERTSLLTQIRQNISTPIQQSSGHKGRLARLFGR
ncbi:MAG: hypothetical protein ACTSVB_07975 [Candidatus Heimdallarchaeaceae archaeon]